jgi:type III pantothenate kinase
MNLVIDIGNTLAKLAIFDEDNIVDQLKVKKFDWEIIETYCLKHTLEGIIVSDVAGQMDNYCERLKEYGTLIVMNTLTPTPLHIKYKSIDTLGTDRIAASVFGSSLFKDTNTLIIQAGTCITYDLVTAKKEYLGGGISPGLDMRFEAMHTFTSKLPLVKKEKIDFLIGNSTQNSILSGVINGCAAEIDGIIDKYEEIFTDLTVVLGGGDTFFFDKTLKNRIFASANLVLNGLNIILEHNK